MRDRAEIGRTEIGRVDDEADGDEESTPVFEIETPPAPAGPSRATVITGVVLYAVCSSTLLVINKVAVHLMPDASFVLLCQFFTSAAAVRCIYWCYPDADIETLKWSKVKPFSVATAVFYVCLLSNTQALRFVNVEAVIVVRSCSPIAVSVVEHLTLGRDLPNCAGVMSLLAISGGAGIYALGGEGIQVDGIVWLAIYFVFIVTEMVFVKFVVDTVPMSTWTRVYYNNALSIPLALGSDIFAGDISFVKVEWTPGAVLAVSLSCVVGVAISYAGFNLRKLVSATSFTVVGVVCKLVTVLINDVIWTHHSNAIGHLGLVVCIFAGFCYERSKRTS
jgi:GDP-mannose transporter